MLYGRNAVLEALRAGREMRRVMVATGAHGEAITEIVDETRARKINLQSVDRRRLDAIAMNHQGVVAEVAPFVYASLEEVIEATRNTETPPLVLVLDVLQDPQNLGSLLRTAAAVGAQGIVLLEHRAVGVTPAVMKSSAARPSGCESPRSATSRTPLTRSRRPVSGPSAWTPAPRSATTRPT